MNRARDWSSIEHILHSKFNLLEFYLNIILFNLLKYRICFSIGSWHPIKKWNQMYFDIIIAYSSKLLFVHYGLCIIKIWLQTNLFCLCKMEEIQVRGKNRLYFGFSNETIYIIYDKYICHIFVNNSLQWINAYLALKFTKWHHKPFLSSS